MHSSFTAAVLLLGAAGACAHAQPPAADSSQPVPFVIRWDDAAKQTATDMSGLDASPAGRNGYIVVKNGHFTESKTGRRIRFLGVNFTFEADFPEHADADKVAAHLAKLGINIVRIHHEDWNRSPLWDKTAKGRTKFDPAGLDRLDYLVAQLKRNGIYVDLNLHVSRTFSADDGFAASVNEIPLNYDKRIDNIDRRMIELQKQFASAYLTHVNPYTGLSYANDPAVALIEINNENSLASAPADGFGYFSLLPEPFRSEVIKDWNNFLAAKYGSDQRLRAAWTLAPAAEPQGPADVLNSSVAWHVEDRVGDVKLSRLTSGTATAMPDVEAVNPTASSPNWYKQLHASGIDLADGKLYTVSLRAKADKPVQVPLQIRDDQPDWHNVGLDTVMNVGDTWQPYQFTFQASRPEPHHTRLSFVIGGNQATIYLADVRLSQTANYDPLNPGESLEARNIGLPTTMTTAQRADWRQFLATSETAYAAEMRHYLRDALRVHAQIIDSQMSYGELVSFQREAGSDYADNHAYWQHPTFPRKDWDQADWVIRNTPMTDSLASGEGGELARLASFRVAGKPYTVSEYNHPAPSEFQEEMMPEISSFAALQDWDGVFVFDFGSYGASRDNDRIQGFFAMQGNPAIEAFMPAAALLFRGGEVSSLPSETTIHLPPSAPFSNSDIKTEWARAGGGKAPDLFSQRVQTIVDSTARSSTLSSSRSPGAAPVVTVSGAPGQSSFIVADSNAVAATGYLGGRQLKSSGIELTFPSFGNGFASMTLTPVDGLPIRTSRRLLLTIMGKASNVDMGWNEDHTSVEQEWGRGPAQAEAIPATMVLENSVVRHVWALSPTGARVKEAPSTLSGGRLEARLGPSCGTVWYEISAN